MWIRNFSENRNGFPLYIPYTNASEVLRQDATTRTTAHAF